MRYEITLKKLQELHAKENYLDHFIGDDDTRYDVFNEDGTINTKATEALLELATENRRRRELIQCIFTLIN